MALPGDRAENRVFWWILALGGVMGCAASGPSNSSDGGSPNVPGAGGGPNVPGPAGANTTVNGVGGAGPATTPTGSVYGDAHQGVYHLGPVDFAETAFHNACAPEGGYRDLLRDATGLHGEYLAGLANEAAKSGATCDACISILTGTGKAIVVRIVTYGDETGPNDIDVSPSVFSAIHTGEYPRSMSWQFTQCPDTGTLRYEFQTGANEWWTSFWVRNQRVPVTKVEVQSKNHSGFKELRRETDGTLNDDSGFGSGAFTLRLTAVDGQTITDTFPSFSPGQLIVSTQQFR